MTTRSLGILPYKKPPILCIVQLIKYEPPPHFSETFIDPEEVEPSFVFALLGISVKSSGSPP
jgi:hypothetical protein